MFLGHAQLFLGLLALPDVAPNKCPANNPDSTQEREQTHKSKIAGLAVRERRRGHVDVNLDRALETVVVHDRDIGFAHDRSTATKFFLFLDFHEGLALRHEIGEIGLCVGLAYVDGAGREDDDAIRPEHLVSKDVAGLSREFENSLVVFGD